VELEDFLQPILLTIVKYILIFGCSYLLTVLVFPTIRELISRSGFVKPNYREEKIPAISGLIFVALLPIITGVNMLFLVNSVYNSMLFLFIIVGMGFMGLVDDQMGNPHSKGFKGHFLTLIKSRQLTSGCFKALFGASIALVFSIGVALSVKSPWLLWNILINFLLVSLAANMVNLFDLRPGRAGKIYLLAFLVIIAFSQNLENYFGLFIPLVGIILYYLPFDLRAEVMMGDVGSNVLGASLGMMMAWMFNDVSKIVALTMMIVLQLSAEKVSFSKVIERFTILRFIDDIGRRKQ
jgi:UDP-GlcNAc:undecaprenyl-phosphate GlcNAc-1-phosphate transferase